MRIRGLVIAVVALTALLGVSCGRSGTSKHRAPATATGVKPLSFEKREKHQTLEDCPEQLAPCASISLGYFELTSGPPPLRDSVAAFLDTTVFAAVDERDEGGGAAMADTLMQRFLDEYRDFSEEFPDSPASWTIQRRATPVWNDGRLFSIEFSEESYTGGAHPNALVRLMTLNAHDGHRVSLDELFVPGYGARLTALGERAFRKAHDLAATDDLVAAGFWFEGGAFQLNDNWAVTGEGLRFHYNAYEVAPYAMGPTDILLGRKALAPLIRPGGPLAAPAGA